VKRFVVIEGEGEGVVSCFCRELSGEKTSTLFTTEEKEGVLGGHSVRILGNEKEEGGGITLPKEGRDLLYENFGERGEAVHALKERSTSGQVSERKAGRRFRGGKGVTLRQLKRGRGKSTRRHHSKEKSDQLKEKGKNRAFRKRKLKSTEGGTPSSSEQGKNGSSTTEKGKRKSPPSSVGKRPPAYTR